MTNKKKGLLSGLIYIEIIKVYSNQFKFICLKFLMMYPTVVFRLTHPELILICIMAFFANYCGHDGRPLNPFPNISPILLALILHAHCLLLMVTVEPFKKVLFPLIYHFQCSFVNFGAQVVMS